jgi:hypothetical protein
MIIHPLGVQIYESRISDQFYDYLVQEINKIDLKNKRYQNGNFVSGGDYTLLDQSNKENFESVIVKHCAEYTSSTGFVLTDMWVNMMAHDEFFPLHTHNGTVSFVIYIKIPELMPQENNDKPIGVAYAEGSIQFQYGHKTQLYNPSLNINPTEKMILMFPSEVQHYVYPFRNRNDKRISISGNLERVK